MAESNGFSMNQFKKDNPDLNAGDEQAFAFEDVIGNIEEDTQNSMVDSQEAEATGSEESEEEGDRVVQVQDSDEVDDKPSSESEAPSLMPESQTPAEDDLIGEHADLFMWDDEAQTYLPKDEAAARAIAVLGDDLDIQRFDPDTGEYTQMEYSLVNREMLARQTPKLTPKESDSEAEEIVTGRRRAVHEQEGEQGKISLYQPADAADALVNGAVGLACKVVGSVYGALKVGLKKGGEDLARAFEKWEASREERYSETPTEQADDISQAVQAASLDDEGEVPQSTPQPGSISEKLKASQNDGQQWVEDHTATLRAGILENMSALSETLELDKADRAFSTPDELEQYIDSLSQEKKDRVRSLQENIKSSINEAKTSADEWINGGGPKSFSALHEDDPVLADKARTKMKREYDEIAQEGKSQNEKLWDLLKVDDQGGKTLGEMFGTFGESIKRMFHTAFSKLALRASVGDANTHHAPTAG